MDKTFIFLHDLNHSGTSRAAVLLANKIANCQLIVLGKKKKYPYEISDNVDVNFLGLSRPSSLFSKLLYLPSSLVCILKFLKRERPKNLIVYGKEFGCVFLFLRCLFKLDFKVIIIQSTYISGQLRFMKGAVSRIIHKWIYNKVMPSAEHHIAICNGVAQDMVNNYRIKDVDISVVYPPIDYSFFKDSASCERKKEILFVGRLDVYKAPEVMIRIFQKIYEENDVILRIVGDGSLRDELEEFCKSNHLERCVVFEGSQSDVMQYMKNSSVLAMTSKFEGFGMVLAEAIACGTPVISFDCPVGPSDIIVDGINGFLVRNSDEEEFEKKIVEAINIKWNEADIKKTAEKFHPDKVLNGYINVISKVFK